MVHISQVCAVIDLENVCMRVALGQRSVHTRDVRNNIFGEHYEASKISLLSIWENHLAPKPMLQL